MCKKILTQYLKKFDFQYLISLITFQVVKRLWMFPSDEVANCKDSWGPNIRLTW